MSPSSKLRTPRKWLWLLNVSPLLQGKVKTKANQATLVEPDGENEVTIIFEAQSTGDALPEGYRPLAEFEFSRIFCPFYAVSLLIRTAKRSGQWFVPTNDDFKGRPPIMVTRDLTYRMVEISSTGVLTDKPFLVREDSADLAERLHLAH